MRILECVTNSDIVKNSDSYEAEGRMRDERFCKTGGTYIRSGILQLLEMRRSMGLHFIRMGVDRVPVLRSRLGLRDSVLTIG